MNAPRRLLLVALALACVAADPECAVVDSADEMLVMDLADSETGELLELPPGAPWVRPGSDGRLGTEDDEVSRFVLPADIDLVVRTGMRSFSGPVPSPTLLSGAPEVVVEPFGAGTPVEFVVAAVNGWIGKYYLVPVDPESLAGSPVLLMAFADLDGDGWIGITHADGDPLDASIEEAELEPVGRRIAIADGGRASGELFVSAGGPPGAELQVIVGAAAFTAPFDSAHFGGVVPSGPMVMTKLPFQPETDPDEVIDGNLPGPADPMGLVGVEVKSALDPDPGVPEIGEAYTVALDGSSYSVDGALARSGSFVRFGLVAEPAPATFRDLPSRPLRPGLGPLGERRVFEVLEHAFLADDGGSSSRSMRVVALDRLGNVTAPPTPAVVTVVAEPPLRITAPDSDGDSSREVLSLPDARGVGVTIDDSGGPFDGPDQGGLRVEFDSGLFQLPVWLPDPDVDDSGFVDAADVAFAEALDRLEVGDAGFDFRADLTGDGRIDDDDFDAIEAESGRSVPVP